MSNPISPESLLQIPLIRAALLDPHFKQVERAVDQSWKNEGLISVSVAGFNPFLSQGFFGKNSALSKWLVDSTQSARPFNTSDELVKEALFITHDYLHTWAILAIRELVGDQLAFGSEAVTSKNFEDYIFCHLLTEAVATVGLDYWFLAQVHLNEICPIGTRVRALTIGYHRDYDAEIAHFNPGLKIKHPLFFEFMARFYCDGVLSGFRLQDLKNSAFLMTWVDHEVMYGERQREIARLWFSYLSKEGPKSGTFNSPVKIKKAWQEKLMFELGEMLWQSLKTPEKFVLESFDSSELWKYADTRKPDPRFSNLNGHDWKALLKSATHSSEKIDFLIYQYVSQFELKKSAPKDRALISEFIQKKDLKSLERFFAKQKPLRSLATEPRHLILLN